MTHVAVLESLQPRTRSAGLRLGRRFRRTGGMSSSTRVHALDHDNSELTLCGRSAAMMWPLERNFEDDLGGRNCCDLCADATAARGAVL
jgi:hypothetical protein